MSEDQFDWERSTSAIVCFWDHATFSACIALDGVTPNELAHLIHQTVRNEPITPGRLAGIFAHFASEISDIALTNVPPAASTGATLSRMHLPDNAPGGMGLVLVDQEKDELIVYGGTGFDVDYNTYQARHYQLDDIMKRLPVPLNLDPLEAQKMKTTLMRESVDALTQAQGKKKATRKRGG